MKHHDHHPAAEPTQRGPAGTATDSLQAPEPSTTTTTAPARPGVGAGLWNVVTGLIATVAGITPHVLHHVGLFAGAFLVTGAASNVLFGALGLLLSVPLLRRLYRRFGTWKAPAIAVGVFAIMFSISAFVIGPAISQENQPPTPAPGQGPSPDEHAGHHD